MLKEKMQKSKVGKIGNVQGNKKKKKIIHQETDGKK